MDNSRSLHGSQVLLLGVPRSSDSARRERAMTEVMDGLRMHSFRIALPTKPVAPVMMTFMVMGWG